jgi:hypothetical protein
MAVGENHRMVMACLSAAVPNIPEENLGKIVLETNDADLTMIVREGDRK